MVPSDRLYTKKDGPKGYYSQPVRVLLTGPARYKIPGFLRAARKGTTLARKVLPWPVRVLPLVPLRAAIEILARASSNHYSLVRPQNKHDFCKNMLHSPHLLST